MNLLVLLQYVAISVSVSAIKQHRPHVQQLQAHGGHPQKHLKQH